MRIESSTGLRNGTTANSQTETNMLFMVIERFQGNDMIPIYRRLRDGVGRYRKV
jgi:hypothetical protein